LYMNIFSFINPTLAMFYSYYLHEVELLVQGGAIIWHFKVSKKKILIPLLKIPFFFCFVNVCGVLFWCHFLWLLYFCKIIFYRLTNCKHWSLNWNLYIYIYIYIYIWFPLLSSFNTSWFKEKWNQMLLMVLIYL
jgi:hypothetical protein